MNILIVDDREENRYLLERLLQGNGHTVRQAANGAEAMEILTAGGIDLVISDILMPVMDGFQLCRKVKTDETLHAIPFIVYTATYTGPQDEAFALKIGADRFIQKPCEVDVLLSAINEVMAVGGGRVAEPVQEEEALKLYSERLIRKLEQKMLQAEQELQARQEAEQALRESESRFRLLAETAPVGIIIEDRDQNVLYVSPTCISLCGYAPEETPTMEAWFSLVCPDETLRNRVRAEWAAAVETATKTGVEIQPMEFPVTCRDGTVRDIEFRMSATQDLDFVVLSDVTSRRRAEQALRESERKYRRLAENTSDVVWTADMNLNTTYVSPSVERLVGEPVGLHIQRTMEEKFPADSLNRLYAVFAKELENEKDPACDKNRSRLVEVQHFRADSSTVWVSINISFIRDTTGRPIGLQGITRDITERKQAEQALRESEERYRTILENIEAGYYEVDLAGNFTFFNQAMCQILGYAEDELLGMNNRSYMDDENAKKVFHTFNQVFTSGKTAKAFDWELIRKDNTRCFVDTSIALMRDAENNPVGFRGIARDISEWKQAEAERERLSTQLLQAQKMESVGRLAGGVAHDFNNMLSVILGYTELAMHRVPPHDPLYEDLREILSAAKRSSEITRQLLAFARKQTSSPKVIDLSDTVENMLKMLRRLIGEDIDLAWNPGPGLWTVNMDPAQISQILANLLVNARDAIGGVGKVTIETGNVSFDQDYCEDHNEFLPGDYVVLAVSDDGCGMDRKTRDRLFEPFFTTKEVGKGTGLGLATVYGIVSQNNGFINVYSEPGQGTTFRIYLPRHGGALSTAHQPGPATAPRGTGETILVVEDEAAILKLTQRVLSGLGYTVLTAETPAQALKLAMEHSDRIDLLITDVIMPEMNGRDLADRLNALQPDLKILYMSGYTADVIAHRGILEPGVHFIQKPFSNQDLAKKVKAVLGG
ncbi:PAS domain S-box protein [Desulfosudis oleivorans]|nr:PAS domain S-box protein [Desulfosudis oleivorans]